MDEAAASPLVNDDERRILADHKGLNAAAHILDAGPEGRCLLVNYVKLKGDDIAHHEILHVGDRQLLARHVRTYANAVLPREKAVLSLDSRFVAPGTRADRTAPLEISRYFRPTISKPPTSISFIRRCCCSTSSSIELIRAGP